MSPFQCQGGVAHSVNPNDLADPVFVLAPARSFTSVVGAMLGRHPQLYGLPETHLFQFETLAEWRQRAGKVSLFMKDGLLRTIAELFFGGQTEIAVRRARGWLRQQLHLTGGAMMEALAERVHPRVLVDKSPGLSRSKWSMRRAYAMFPQARFVHLLRHPRGHGASLMKILEKQAQGGQVPQAAWVIELASFPPPPPAPGEALEPAAPEGCLDPQWFWYTLNRKILDFLASVPAAQVFRIRGEEILTDPDAALRPLVAWLGLRDDPEAIDEMKHPERSPYACFGPRGARFGNDYGFLRNPTLRSSRVEAASLDGPLPWRTDGQGFAPAVRRLAQEFGYT